MDLPCSVLQESRRAPAAGFVKRDAIEQIAFRGTEFGVNEAARLEHRRREVEDGA